MRSPSRNGLRVWDISSRRLVLASAAAVVIFAPNNASAIIAFADQEARVLRDLVSGAQEPFNYNEGGSIATLRACNVAGSHFCQCG